MRRRLVAALVGVAVLTLVLYAGPRAFMIADLVRGHEERVIEDGVELIATRIELHVAKGDPVTAAALEDLVDPGERIVVQLEDGRKIAVDEQVGDERVITRTRPVPGVGTVLLEIPRARVDDRVADEMLPIAVAATGTLLAAIAVATVLSRRLTAPFGSLGSYIDDVEAGDETPPPRSGVAEADALADALERSHQRIREVLQREREFSTNASHQLRTPLAALRLRLEDLATWPELRGDVREEVDAALAEALRLSDTVTDLLSLARSGGIGGWREIDLREEVGAAIDRWRPMFTEVDRRLELRPPLQPTRAQTSPSALQQILDVIFENSVSHGCGVTDVYLERLGESVTVRITDEGTVDAQVAPRLFDRDVRSPTSRGLGIGLGLAGTIARSAGARLALVSQDPTVFEIVFSAVTPPAEAGAAS